ncbi:MAG: plastocyanin/azurin family copper-binding protein [Bacteroidota bacterium]
MKTKWINLDGLGKMKIIALGAWIVLTGGTAMACDYCNKKFYDDITNGARQNTIVGKEMLLAMKNQGGPNPYASPSPEKKGEEFIQIINRDNSLSIPATSYVPQDTKPDKSVTIELSEGEAYMGKGVMFNGFTTNGTIPGPTFIFEEGDVIEFNVVNKGKVPHGASIHAAYTQTSKYLGKINPGEAKKMVFKVTYPGVYMYHCAPGGHAIPMHVLFGQYGMMVVKPKAKFKMEEVLGKKPDVEIYLNQHEWYTSGKDAIEGNPMYTTFNGKIFKYVEEPIKAKPGDYVRIYFLNTGPNLVSTFHIVGIVFDYCYWQGLPENIFKGGQSVIAGPTDSWVVEFRMPPDEGNYLMLSHAVGSTDRGAIGLLVCDKNAKTPLTVMADGPKYTDQEMAEFKKTAIRTISPFEPGSLDVDAFVEYGPETKEVVVKIIGNSFYPKRIKVAKGTTIKWINEEVFTYMEGEFSGIHNAVVYEGPENWASPLLAHGESYKFTVNTPGEYKYMCGPHPYMKGEVVVIDSVEMVSASASGGGSGLLATILSIVAVLVSISIFVFRE